MGEATRMPAITEVTVRPMLVKDIDEVLEVECQSFTTPWSRQAFEQELGENDLAIYLVAEQQGKIAGYAGTWIILDEAHVTNIAVLPETRGRGVGRVLLTTLIEYAKVAGAGSMTLEVRVSNDVAKSLYESMGFVVRGCRPKYYSDSGEDALIMWRHAL